MFVVISKKTVTACDGVTNLGCYFSAIGERIHWILHHADDKLVMNLCI
jgi:hypothetical protein